jgi:hypothetical protein
MEEVGGTVQNHIDRGQHSQVVVPIQCACRCTKLFRIGMNGSRFRQDRVMHVDHGRSPDMPHGGQFMHPGAVVALVVGIMMRCSPAVKHQGGFHRIEAVFGHHDVNVGKKTPPG